MESFLMFLGVIVWVFALLGAAHWLDNRERKKAKAVNIQNFGDNLPRTSWMTQAQKFHGERVALRNKL